ncbi:glycosyltransferase [Salipiger sp. 1_MG-2023]|uniref:glycosyltransferase n=1 Tax=Salipiger sp. 1_MG-2023 TaxID=3062665 RepID=UPI0026E238AD|nr:glycosyltransferase [Salipiger sp. 1_MG-2023]MDO6587665.1 glycosyltransferase [Salipiger sp. 1_MG-2023]
MTQHSLTAVDPGAFAASGTVIVIPARNEQVYIADCLDSLFAQATPRRAGIVICVNNTTDDTAAIALDRARSRRWPLIVIQADLAKGGVGQARRLGHRVALRAAPHASVLLSTDADCRPAPRWQAEMEMTLRRAPAVLGRIEVAAQELAGFPGQFLRRQHIENDFAELAMEFERLMDPAGPNGIGLNTAGGANLGFRRATYLHVGGYRAMPSGEDRDIIARVRQAGLRPIRADRAVVVASMRLIGRAPGGMADQILARSGCGDSSVDSALVPFEAMVAQHLGRQTPSLPMTLSRAMQDLPLLRDCVEGLRGLSCIHSRRRHLAALLQNPLEMESGCGTEDADDSWN